MYNYAGPLPPGGGARGGDVARREPTRGGGFQPAGAGYVSSSTTVWQGIAAGSISGPQFGRRGRGAPTTTRPAAAGRPVIVVALVDVGEEVEAAGDVGRFGGATHSMGA